MVTSLPSDRHPRCCLQVLPVKRSLGALPAPASVELLAIAGPLEGAESPTRNPPRMMMLDAAPAPSSQALLAHP